MHFKILEKKGEQERVKEISTSTHMTNTHVEMITTHHTRIYFWECNSRKAIKHRKIKYKIVGGLRRDARGRKE